MNANTDIGWNCEEVVIQILNQTASLKSLNPVHEDSDNDIDSRRIIVQAEKVDNEAPNANNEQLSVKRVYMKVLIRSGLGQMSANDLYSNFGTMCGVLENMGQPIYNSLPALANFSYLVLTPDLGTDREKEDNRRKMTKNFEFLAILKNSPLPP